MSLVGDHFLYSYNCNVLLMADIVMRSQMLVTLRYQRVKEPPFKGQLCILGKVPKCYLLKIFKV